MQRKACHATLASFSVLMIARKHSLGLFIRPYALNGFSPFSGLQPARGRKMDASLCNSDAEKGNLLLSTIQLV
jgi:hypothetical protein